METKKRTLREISKNPENMTEEERKDMAELFASLKEVGKACEPYDIKTHILQMFLQLYIMRSLPIH